MIRSVSVCALILALAGSAASWAQRPGPTQPARDTPAQGKDTTPPPAGLISGRVLTAENGRPVKRARVFVTAAELPGGRGTLTDDSGVFELTELPTGRYTLTVSKSGYISLSYGQRRPLQAGTPLQLGDGQQLKGVEFRLPRGSVVAGHVTDETGDPMPGVMVRVLRYQYLQGDRRLVAAGTAQTDDLGQYRVWGLTPGEYYVDAQARLNLGFGGGPGGGRGGPGGRGGGFNGAIAGVVGAIAGSNVASLFGPEDESQKAYAPTYFPGVTAIAEAKPITVGLSQESLDVDFALQLVHVARVSGHVTDPDGNATGSGNVTLVAEGGAAGRGAFGITYGGRIQWDGSFQITNVPPGQYTLQARGTDAGTPQFASQPLAVTSTDIDNVSLLLAASASVAGTITLTPGAQTQAPDLTNLRVTAPSTDSTVGGPSQGRVDKEGQFTVEGLAAGPHLIRPGGQMRGWTLKSVTVNGRDVTDTPVVLRSGERLDRVEIALTDRSTQVNGALTDQQGKPVTEYTVLAFSTDPAFWQAQSRHIATARPDQTGQFKLNGLPAGSYYLATVDPAEQGEWFEPTYLEQHRLGATRVALGEGETKTQDIKIRTQN